MGIFSKKPIQAQEPVPDIDPIVLAVTCITTAGPDVAVSLALVIYKLLETAAVSTDDLAKLGLSRDELGALVSAIQESDSAEEFNDALELRTALLQYNAELTTIAGELGISTKSEEYVALRSAVAGFAEQNDILDIKLAYRLILAECPELIPGSTAR